MIISKNPFFISENDYTTCFVKLLFQKTVFSQFYGLSYGLARYLEHENLDYEKSTQEMCIFKITFSLVNNFYNNVIDHLYLKVPVFKIKAEIDGMKDKDTFTYSISEYGALIILGCAFEELILTKQKRNAV